MPEIKQIVRIVNKDIVGTKKLGIALTQIYGVSFSLSSAVCNKLNLDKNIEIGSLSQDQITKLQDTIKNPDSIPSFLYNRTRDRETGKDLHLSSADLKLTREFDVKRLKKIKSYRGIRHALSLPLRGQRTRSNFRKGKAVGVTKKKKVPSKKAGGKK